MEKENAKIIDISTRQTVGNEKNEPQKKASGWKKAAVVIAVVLFVGVWAYIFVNQEIKLREQQSRMMYLEDIKNSHEASIRGKREKLNMQESESFIEEIARNKLNYVKNGEIVFLPIE
ncbi:MAG: septum formation initiator family protein [Eubacteriales bacterium]|nr:septum formation initiator family protein [Eubacteriales bacterium]